VPVFNTTNASFDKNVYSVKLKTKIMEIRNDNTHFEELEVSWKEVKLSKYHSYNVHMREISLDFEINFSLLGGHDRVQVPLVSAASNL
jgi:hypothetical protein